jgi:hypothetical protein
MHCDFCHVEVGDNPLTFKHPKIRVPSGSMTFESGKWAACLECGKLHEEGNLKELIARALLSGPNRIVTMRMSLKNLKGMVNDFNYLYKRISRKGYYSNTGNV